MYIFYKLISCICYNHSVYIHLCALSNYFLTMNYILPKYVTPVYIVSKKAENALPKRVVINIKRGWYPILLNNFLLNIISTSVENELLNPKDTSSKRHILVFFLHTITCSQSIISHHTVHQVRHITIMLGNIICICFIQIIKLSLF